MPPANPAEQLQHAPIGDLIILLLKQFKHLIAEQGITLTTADIEAIAREIGSVPPELRAAIAHLVAESVDYLKTRFNLSFAESLAQDMDTIGGWETTADFLEIANHKSNAELRISAGASLLAFLGDTRFADALLAVIAADDGLLDVDAMFAKRALSHATGVEFAATDWTTQVRTQLA